MKSSAVEQSLYRSARDNTFYNSIFNYFFMFMFYVVHNLYIVVLQLTSSLYAPFTCFRLSLYIYYVIYYIAVV